MEYIAEKPHYKHNRTKDGTIKRVVFIHQNTEEILSDTGNFDAAAHRYVDHHWRKFGGGTFHLHFVLIDSGGTAIQKYF